MVIGSSAEHYRLAARPPSGAGVAAVSAAVVGLAVGAALAARRLGRVVVRGESMRPTLEPGDRLVVVRGGRSVRTGDLVTLPDPRRPARAVVKRVTALTESGVVVSGDNPKASSDSRTFGAVPASAIAGRVVYRYFPEERRGRLRTGRYAGTDVV